MSISIRVGKDFVQVTANVVPHSAAGEAQLCLNEFDTKQALLAMLEGVEQGENNILFLRLQLRHMDSGFYKVGMAATTLVLCCSMESEWHISSPF